MHAPRSDANHEHGPASCQPWLFRAGALDPSLLRKPGPARMSLRFTARRREQGLKRGHDHLAPTPQEEPQQRFTAPCTGCGPGVA